MPEIIMISDNFEVDLSKISEIGEIIELNESNKMFCFALGFKDGSFKNVCLHYNENNKTQIKQRANKLHRKISSFMEKNKGRP